MVRYRGDEKIPTSLFEVAAYQKTLKVRCISCGHEAVFSGHALWWLFRERHWRDHMDYVRERFRCDRCGAKRINLLLGTWPPTVTSLPMPDEGEWKRAVQRYRS